MGEHSAIPFFGSLLGLFHLRLFRIVVRLAPERKGIVKQHEFADEIDQLGGDLILSEVCQKVRGNAAAVDDLLPGFEEVFQNVVDHLAGSDVLMANRVKLIHAEADAEEAVLAGFLPALPLGAVAAGGSQAADHFAVRDIHQRVEMQSAILLSVLKDAHVVPAAAGMEIGQTSAEGSAEVLLAVESAVLVGDGDKIVPLVEIGFLTEAALAEVEIMLLALDHAGDPCCIIAVKDAVMLVHIVGDPELDVLLLDAGVQSGTVGKIKECDRKVFAGGLILLAFAADACGRDCDHMVSVTVDAACGMDAAVGHQSDPCGGTGDAVLLGQAVANPFRAVRRGDAFGQSGGIGGGKGFLSVDQFLVAQLRHSAKLLSGEIVGLECEKMREVVRRRTGWAGWCRSLAVSTIPIEKLCKYGKPTGRVSHIHTAFQQGTRLGSGAEPW